MNHPLWRSTNRSLYRFRNHPLWRSRNHPLWRSRNHPLWRSRNRSPYRFRNHLLYQLMNYPLWQSRNRSLYRFRNLYCSRYLGITLSQYPGSRRGIIHQNRRGITQHIGLEFWTGCVRKLCYRYMKMIEIYEDRCYFHLVFASCFIDTWIL